ncbi:plasmid mobilization relaxosome protein MobC, partial [Acinetobacter nosocomialis]
RIGGNINQIAKAINTDIASSRPLDAARLLHLLIGIDQTLKELKK